MAKAEEKVIEEVVEETTEAVEEKVEEKKVAKKEKRYIVKTPVKNFNGEVAGVHFAYGKAEIKEDCWILQWFKEKGYDVEEVK